MTTQHEIGSLGLDQPLEARAPLGVPPTPFPEVGIPSADVRRLLHDKLAQNLPPERNWTVYGPAAHPLAKEIYAIPEAIDTYSVEFYRDIYPGILEMSQESVRMLGSLLHAEDPAGYITTGGTEANVLSIRLARNLAGKERPEIIASLTRHYSFDLESELLGVAIRTVDVTQDYKPKVEEVESLVNENTVALICSAPEGNIGAIDPVEQFAALAEKHGLYFHVDAAVGGYLFPFLDRMGRDVPVFDFRLPQVCSMTIDPHKLGLAPRPSGALIVRDMSVLEQGVPIDDVAIDTLVASGRPGSATAAVWCMIKHLGMNGYQELVEHQFELVAQLTEGISEIPGLRLLEDPETNIVCFTGSGDLAQVSRDLWGRGYVIPLNQLIPYDVWYLRLYVHPLKTQADAQQLLSDLAQVVGPS